MRRTPASDVVDQDGEAVRVTWWRWSALAVVVVLGLVACGTGGGGGVPVVTAIESFTVSPNPVAANGTLTLSWRAVNVGLSGGSPYCALQRNVQSGPAEDLEVVPCVGTLVRTAPSQATVMTYRLSALRRDGATYVTRDVTVMVEPPSPMLVEVDTSLIAGTTVTLPLRGSVDVSVDWGDGQTSTATTGGDLQHTYASNGSYTIGIRGRLEQFGAGLDGYSHADAITGVSAWGDLGLARLNGAFAGARNLTSVPLTLPPTVTSLFSMFWGARSFNHPIGSWDTSNVEVMQSMFHGASVFNQPIGDWNTSNVIFMHFMFTDAAAFNQPIGSWDTSNVPTLQFMFSGATAFDQPIGSWDTSRVDGMFGMFGGATAFNQPLDGWDTGNVADMRALFAGATSFNQSIGHWDTSRATDMRWMFEGASAFNQDVSDWCVANIPSRPDGFDDGATSWSLPRPVWGTCP
jgi:surface protein